MKFFSPQNVLYIEYFFYGSGVFKADDFALSDRNYAAFFEAQGIDFTGVAEKYDLLRQMICDGAISDSQIGDSEILFNIYRGNGGTAFDAVEAVNTERTYISVAFAPYQSPIRGIVPVARERKRLADKHIFKHDIIKNSAVREGREKVGESDRITVISPVNIADRYVTDTAAA